MNGDSTWTKIPHDRDEFRPVPDLEGIAGEIRQALEGVTPDGVEMTAFVYESIFGPTAEIEMSDADRALIAAAPGLLARAADRIEQLEAAIANLGEQASRRFNTDGECMSCFAPAHAGWFGGNGRHEPGCIVAAAINIAKEGA